ncbi:hypothetical protein VNO77_20677 [Canavalia gladiata]|uniref:Uncharacterized protein n=1 Tax=Canavalia gladiata TaxID=3824 RepID=A0AAN9LQK2_CANGL
MNTSQPQQLNVVFLPYVAPGHMIPVVDTARVFARHGANVTIITTHANALTFQKAIDSDFSRGYCIRTHVLQFPASQVGLPDGVENVKAGTSQEMVYNISLGISMLQDQIELLFQDLQPDCFVTDILHTWAVESAAKLNIPRLHFFLSSYFTSCTTHFIRKHKPHERLASDTQKFLIPGLPHNIEITTLQLEEWVRTKNQFSDSLGSVYDSENKSYGALYNSFHEIEGDYEKLYTSTKGIKSWSVGPVSAWVNRGDEEKANRGHKEDIAQESEWLNWLNSKQNESVLYVSFGSLTRLSHGQIVEIAYGLEDSGHDFILVIRKKDGVGSKENKIWTSTVDTVVRREEIAKAVVLLMGSEEESKEMRRKARELGDAAMKTIEEGGSSYNNLMQLLDELKSLKISRALEKNKLDT